MIKLKCGLLCGNQLICSSVIDLLISSESPHCLPWKREVENSNDFF